MDRPKAGTLLAALLVAILGWCSGLAAQSVTSGGLSGTVVDPLGQPVAQARVIATSLATGWERLVTTQVNGAFRITQVPPDEYELFIEIVGYRPARVIGIPVRPGRDIRVPVSLVPAAPPVLRVDTLSLDIGVNRSMAPGGGRWLPEEAVNVYPDPLRTISTLSALSSRFDPSMGSEGLPASMTRIFIDGVAFVPARHPWLPGGGAEELILPRSGLAYLALPEIRTDIEWLGGAGGYTIVGTRSGAHRGSADLFGGGSGDPLWSSGPFNAEVPGILSLWGGARASIPLPADSTRLFIAAEGYQTETPRLPILPASTASALPGIGDGASGLGAPWVERRRSVSGSARVGWTLTPATTLQFSALVGTLDVSHGLGVRSPAPYGTTPPLSALDLLFSSTLTTDLFDVGDLEVRVGFQRSVREYAGVGDEPIPGTHLVDSGAWIGLDPYLPAQVTRTSFAGGATFHTRLGEGHNLKAGGQLSVPSLSYDFPRRGIGSFVYPSSDAVTSGEGAFAQIGGPVPASNFSLPTLSGFLQHSWEPTPGLTLTSGIRYDTEFLPDDDVFVDRDWIAASGIEMDGLDPRLGKFGAQVGLRWEVTERGSTVIAFEAATDHGGIDPGALSEALSFGGGVDMRRGPVGPGTWPGLPNETAVPVVGERITVMSPGVKSPRTRRGHVGIWQLLGERTVLHLAGSVRRTDYLLRRSDLNLTAAAAGLDPFGRPVLGTLVQDDGMLTSVGGSNRRFAEFDQVWALNPDGWSEQVAATVSLDHALGERLELFASYTWSRTEDNWLGAASGRPEATLDPGLDDLAPTPWSEATSDFDLPHRVTAGLTVRTSIVTLTGTYRFRSAYPFTAGYRAGVDANGDGSALNDVAFVPDDPAVLDLARSWDCLDTAAGVFAKRNGCRGGGVHALDLRVSFDLFPSTDRWLELVVEGFNLLESEVGLRDTALLLVDPSRQLSVDPTSGVVDVPVTVNPDFGKIVTPTSPGRMVRFGIRLGGGVR